MALLARFAEAGSIGQLCLAYNRRLRAGPDHAAIGDTITQVTRRVVEAARSAAPDMVASLQGLARDPDAAVFVHIASAPGAAMWSRGWPRFKEVVRPGLALDYLALASVAGTGGELAYLDFFDLVSRSAECAVDANELAPHTDACDVFCLAGVQGRPDAWTFVAPLSRVIDALDQRTVDLLMNAEGYEAARDLPQNIAPNRLRDLAGASLDRRFPILVEVDGRMRFHGLARAVYGLHTRVARGVDNEFEAARAALLRGSSHLGLYDRFCLGPGEALVLSCRDTVHAVSPHGLGRWCVRVEGLFCAGGSADPPASDADQSNGLASLLDALKHFTDDTRVDLVDALGRQVDALADPLWWT